MAGRTTELLTLLVAAMTRDLATFGDWKFKKRSLSFVQTTSFGFWSISFQYKSWGGKFLDMTFALGVRFNDVEDLLNLDRYQLKPQEKRDTTSIGTMIVNIRCGLVCDWDIEDALSADKCSREFSVFMRKVGRKYFERNSDPRDVLKRLLSGDSKAIRPGIDSRLGRLVAALSCLYDSNSLDRNVALVEERDLPQERDRQKVGEFVSLLKSLPQRITIH